MSKRTWYRNIAKAAQLDAEDLARELHVLHRTGPPEDKGTDETAQCLVPNASANNIIGSNFKSSDQSEKAEISIDFNVECDVDNDTINCSSEQDLSEISENHNGTFTIDKAPVLSISSNNHFKYCENSESEDIEITEQPIAPKSLASKLAEWALIGNVTHKNVTGLLKILKADHPELPCDSRSLLGTIRHMAPVLAMGKGSFIYFGLETNLQRLLCGIEHYPLELALTFNIDGQSPYNSSKMELWPILCNVDGIPSKPIIVCAYYGRGKPESCKDFMGMFVEEIDYLLNNGLSINGRRTKVIVRAFICDFPAMAFIKCTLHSNGFVGCSKCFVRGVSIERSRVYHGLNDTLRTDNNFRNKEQAENHKGDSPLLKLESLDMVKCFPVDSMHTIFINVIKKLCFVWKKGKNRYVQVQKQVRGKVVPVFKKKSRRFKSKMTAFSIKAVDDRIDNINKFMPCEFARILHGLSDSDTWKANQGRQFIMYVAPVVLRGLLDNDLYQHMLLLHKACRILSSDILCSSMLEEAERLLKRFVHMCKFLLGIDFTTPAVHALIHLPADCDEHGTLDKFSAFPFESYQGELRKLIGGYALPLQQIWRRLSEKENQRIDTNSMQCDEVVSLTRRAKQEYRPTCGQRGDHYVKLKYKGLVMSLTPKDSTLILEDGSIVKASNFLKRGSEWFVIGQMFRNPTDFYPRSSEVYIWKVNGLSGEDFCWPLGFVVGKAVLLPYKHYFVCIRLLHC